MRNYCEIPGDIETGLSKEGGGTISLWACLSFQWGDRVGEGVQTWNCQRVTWALSSLFPLPQMTTAGYIDFFYYLVNLIQKDVASKLFLYPILDYNSVGNLDSRRV